MCYLAVLGAICSFRSLRRCRPAYLIAQSPCAHTMILQRRHQPSKLEVWARHGKQQYHIWSLHIKSGRHEGVGPVTSFQQMSTKACG